jgi:hypothetical protein
MTNFDAETLRDLQELVIRTEKHPKSAVVIWVVVADDEVFVRSWRGAKGRWYRDLAAGGPATLEFAGRRQACRQSPRAIPKRSPGPAASSSGSISGAPMRRRWYAPKPCRPRCGSNRADLRQLQIER